MKKVLFSFLILISILESLAQEDLELKVFIFPTASSTGVVALDLMLPLTLNTTALTSFTLCLKYYTLLTRPFSLFSYATRTNDNELLISKPSPNRYDLAVGRSVVSFTLPEKQTSTPSWEHICTSWESATGIVSFWLNGKPLPRVGVRKGYSISTEASIVLGQEQDSFGGGFDINQSFVGEITDVYLWDQVLSPDKMGCVCSGHILPNNLINWRMLSYETRGYVILKPTLLSSSS